MKVVVIASLAYSLVNFRAALLRAMVEQGHEVVACAPDDDPAVFVALAAMGVRFRKIGMDRAGMNPLRDLATFGALFGLLRDEQPDVVLAYTQKPIVYGGIAARLGLRRAHFYAMVSGLGHAFGDEGGAGRAVLRLILSGLYRLAVARARCVFVFNDCDADEMRRCGILRSRNRVVRVAGSGIDIGAFPPRPVPREGPIFLLVARLLREKGIFEYIDAAKQVRALHPGARFQLLGWLNAGGRGFTREEFDRHLEGSGVEYLGDTRDVRPFLAAASVFVLPTYYREGLPRTILEAMATGRAIVTTDTPGCRETVIEGFNGFLVPPRDSAALAGALEQFARDTTLAARMGRRSRRIAEERFDVRIVNQTVLGAMFDGAGDAPSPPKGKRSAIADLRTAEVPLMLLFGLLLLPLTLLVAAMTLLFLGRPILFVQRRAGRDGVAFPLIKFRTMRILFDDGGRLLPDAARLSRFGRLIRRLRLDELPEVWNILRGDMALVGPRPLLPETVAAMGVAGERRGAVRPGLTGWAQVNGNALLSVREKLALDLWYVAHRSIRLDIYILWRTLVMLITGERVNSALVGRAYAGTADRGC